MKRIDKVKTGIAFMVFLISGSAMDSDCYILMGIIAILSLLYLGRIARRYENEYDN